MFLGVPVLAETAKMNCLPSHIQFSKGLPYLNSQISIELNLYCIKFFIGPRHVFLPCCFIR